MKIVAYLRVSTYAQANQKTIEIQRDQINSYAVNNNIKIDEYYEDDGVSGAVEFFDRPQGAEIWRQIESGEITTLITAKTDRIARSMIAFVHFAKHIKDFGCKMIITQDGFDLTTEQGEMMFNFMAVFAEMDHKNIRKRLDGGKINHARKGKILGAAVYGYRKKNFNLYVDGDEKDIIVKIFEDYLNGASIRDIVKRLNENGVPTPVRAGRGWQPHHISRMLKNPTYKGDYQAFRTSDDFDTIPIEVPAIISVDLFDEVQKEIKNNTWSGRKSKKHTYLLRKLIKCGDCGYSYTGSVHPPRPKPGGGFYPKRLYYVCSSKYRKHTAYEIECHNPSIRSEKIEKPIWELIKKMLAQPSKIIDDIVKTQQKNSTRLNKNILEIKKIESNIKSLLSKRKNIIDFIATGSIEKEEALENLNDLKALITKNETRMAALCDLNKDQDIKPQLKNAEAVLARLGEKLKGDGMMN